MITYGRFLLEEILPFIVDNDKYKFTVVDKNNKTWSVKIGTLRLQCFKRDLKCAHCDRKGFKFLLQAHTDKETPHLNLYSEDDVLMTKDHIFPKSKGGKDHLSNLQTMCLECNLIKADSIEEKE